jgi:hypothetical protein
LEINESAERIALRVTAQNFCFLGLAEVSAVIQIDAVPLTAPGYWYDKHGVLKSAPEQSRRNGASFVYVAETSFVGTVAQVAHWSII